jgi:O-antigen ligase
MLTLAGWLLHAAYKKEKIIFPQEFLPLILFIFLGSLTYFYTTDKPAAAAAISRLLTTLFLLFLTVNIIKPQKHLKLVIASLLIMTAVMGVFAITVRFFPAYLTREEGPVLDSYGVMEDPAEEARVGVIQSSQGATVHPGFYVLNLLIAIPLYVYMVQDASSLLTKLLWGVSGVLATVNLFLTYRRSGVIVLIILLIFMLVKRLIKITPTTLILGTLIASMTLFFMPETFWTRVFSPSAYSVEKAHNVKSRLAMLDAAFMLLKEKWLFGVGLFNQIELPKYKNLRELTGVHSTAHNAYLQLWIETGIFGLIIFLRVLYTFWRDLSVAEKNLSRLQNYSMCQLVGILKTAFLAPILLGFTGVDWNIPMREWWFICGVSVVMKRYSERPPPTSAD